ncbi:hypothetical protein LXL04_028782 [Taraxacum kok-saghyz]
MTGGRVIDKYRSSLNTETAEALICAQDSIRNTRLDLELGCSIKNKDIDEFNEKMTSLKIGNRKRPARIQIPFAPLSITEEISKPNDEVAEIDEEGEEYSVYCKRGKRGSMEDRYSAVVDLQGDTKQLIKAIDEYEGEDPLQPWFACIKWVQDAFPPGGDCSGLVVILEQCVRTFWHEEQYKNDIRYLKVWLEYAGYCDDAEVVYGFLNTNKIGEMHAIFYISYATHLESKNKIKTGNNIYECGIARNAQPIEKLKSAYRKFFTRRNQWTLVNLPEALEPS